MFISPKFDRALGFRMGPLAKYLLLCGFYWKKSEDKFVLTGPYNRMAWISTYYIGQLFQLLLLSYILIMFYLFDTIPEETHSQVVLETPQTQSHLLSVIACTLLWILTTGILSIGSLTKSYHPDFANFLNQANLLHQNLLARFPIKNETFLQIRILKILERLTAFTAYGLLALPFVFGLAIFHPSDPIHRIVEDGLELKMGLKNLIITLPSFAIVVWGTLSFTSIVITVVFIVMVFNYLNLFWLCGAMPTDNSSAQNIFIVRNADENRLVYSTNGLGKITVYELIIVYRSLQILASTGNAFMQKFRIVYHVTSLMLVSIISGFALVKFSSLLQGRTSGSELPMVAIFLCLGGLSVAIFKYECYSQELLENKWKQYRTGLLTKSNRKSVLFMTAKSFRSLSCKTTYPFCNANNSTFLEYCDICVNNLVNLLVSL